MTAHRYGARYEVCSRCGREWNVSLWAPVGEYICPSCAAEKAQKSKEVQKVKINRK